MKYQEKVSTRADVRALYEKVIKQPNIEQYRGYTKTKSYGWDEFANDYVKADGEFWFDNPSYDPNYFASTESEQTVNELKPEDVMRALDCCDKGSKCFCDCDNCPYYGCDVPCKDKLHKDALALLREKDAEIERLKKANQHFAELENGYIVTGYKNIRAEAITEFAESVKMYFETYPENDETHALYVRSLVDQIAEEMKESQNE